MFNSKKIPNPNNIGQQLSGARYTTGLSLKIVAKHIGIDKKYLENLEKNEWHKLPGEIYAKNFLKKYCDFLKINFEQLNINFDTINCFKQINHSQNFTKKTFRKDFLNLPKYLKFSLIILGIIFVLFFFIWQINKITAPPKIILFYPVKNIQISAQTLTISGKTEKEVTLKINNQPVFIDKQNNFSLEINLQPGLNIIRLEAKTKYSKTQVIEREVVVE